MRHLDSMAKVMLATGLFVAYGYTIEAFTAWYSGSPFEQFWLYNRSFGPYRLLFWVMMLCNVVIPQALWFGRVRSNLLLLFVISILINVGMWLERFVIIVVSLHRDFVPAAWGIYAGTIWDWATFIGTLGLFLTLIFLFIRVLPMISIFEMRHLLAEIKKHTGLAETTPRSFAPLASGQAAEVQASEPLYGLLAEFEDAEVLLAKANQTYQAGYRQISAYSPFPIAGLAEALGMRRTKLPYFVFLGGVVGAVGGFLLQYYAAVINYP
jgi:hypothetical protein